MRIRLSVSATAIVALLALSTPAMAQNALDRSPEPGSIHTTLGYCLSPDVHDQMIEILLNKGEAAAVDAYEEAKVMRACRRHRVRAVFLKRTYRFAWPQRPHLTGEQWLIRRQDSGATGYVLIMVQDGRA